ncbi:MAG: hypothetical protein GXO58_03265 [Thermodesulfobacteria bacterium]|nr:hypothetical protein [Thermodesulfobacteriota bacterium]
MVGWRVVGLGVLRLVFLCSNHAATGERSRRDVGCRYDAGFAAPHGRGTQCHTFPCGRGHGYAFAFANIHTLASA